MSREAMKQPEALRLADALDDEFTQGRISNHNGRKAATELRRLHEVNQDLLKALHEALETKQEPVAWMHTTGTGHVYFRKKPQDKVFNPQPVYTAPSKQWVGLNHFDRTLLRTTYAPLKRLHHIKETNTDIVAEIVNDWDAFFTAIEAKLKEKNHG